MRGESGVTAALILLAVAAVVVVAGVSAFLLMQGGGGTGGGSPGQSLPENYFSVNRVYLTDFVDYTGAVSQDSFCIVVEITSGGRFVDEWSAGLDYGGGIGFVDNVVWTDFGGSPDPENHKIVLRETVSKWTFGGGVMHPQRGESVYVKVHLTLGDGSVQEWEGHAEYI